MRKFECSVCGFVFDESEGLPRKGIPAKTKWENIPGDFFCPICNASKSEFKLLGEAVHTPVFSGENTPVADMGELSAGEISAICSNLAKGCEMQRLTAEMESFKKIAEYFKTKMVAEKGMTLKDAAKMLAEDLSDRLPVAYAAAKSNSDRGALRSLVWSEKTGTMMKSLFDRYAKDGDAMLENTNIYVCEVCGYIHLGNAAPGVCPVCKVPEFKIHPVERR